jgi:hypothetical protein
VFEAEGAGTAKSGRAACLEHEDLVDGSTVSKREEVPEGRLGQSCGLLGPGSAGTFSAETVTH